MGAIAAARARCRRLVGPFAALACGPVGRAANRPRHAWPHRGAGLPSLHRGRPARVATAAAPPPPPPARRRRSARAPPRSRIIALLLVDPQAASRGFSSSAAAASRTVAARSPDAAVSEDKSLKSYPISEAAGPPARARVTSKAPALLCLRPPAARRPAGVVPPAEGAPSPAASPLPSPSAASLPRARARAGAARKAREPAA